MAEKHIFDQLTESQATERLACQQVIDLVDAYEKVAGQEPVARQGACL